MSRGPGSGRGLVVHPDLRLRGRCPPHGPGPVDPGLVADLIRTGERSAGVGVAAPQIGVRTRVYVWLGSDGRWRTMVDPVLIPTDPRAVVDVEGCLSIPGAAVAVRRLRAVTVRGRDHLGRPVTVDADGWQARIHQHEIDHLDGILIVDRGPGDPVPPDPGPEDRPGVR